MKTTQKAACLAIALAVAFLPSTARAWLATGAELNSWAQASSRANAGTASIADYTDAARFGGYVIGIVDSMMAENGGAFRNCFGAVVTRGQFMAIVGQYIASHPEQWGESGMALVRWAVNEACKKNLASRMSR